MAKELTITKTFNSARESVWKMWTSPLQFAKWYGLEDSSLSNVKMEVRPGGSWSASMHTPRNPDIFWKADYLEVKPPERLVFALKDPDNLANTNVETISVDLTEEDGKTKMVFKQTGNLPDEDYEKGLKEGWTRYFERFEENLYKM